MIGKANLGTISTFQYVQSVPSWIDLYQNQSSGAGQRGIWIATSVFSICRFCWICQQFLLLDNMFGPLSDQMSAISRANGWEKRGNRWGTKKKEKEKKTAKLKERQIVSISCEIHVFFLPSSTLAKVSHFKAQSNNNKLFKKCYTQNRRFPRYYG